MMAANVLELNKPLLFGISILFFLCASCLGCVGGFVYFNNTLQPTPDWRMLGKPPETITGFLAADFNTVYVRTAHHKIYSCYWASPYDTACWVEAQQPTGLLQYPCPGTVNTSGFILPKPPFPDVVDTIKAEYCSSFAGNVDYSVFEYLLLRDGTVAQWSHDEFDLGLPSGVNRKLVNDLLVWSL